MKIYVDNNFKCHTTAAVDRREFYTPVLDGKCAKYVEGCRYVPAGESWTRPDGVVFRGEMIAPAEDIRLLEAAQTAYEEALDKNADALAALEVLGVEP